jgi:hypothetical protein
MKALFVSIVVVSLILLGAHFLRYGNVFGLAASLVLIGLLFVRSPWAARIIQLGLVLGAIEWGHTLYELVQMRMAQGAPVARMVAIIGTVIVVTLASALVFQTKTMGRMYGLQAGRVSRGGEGNGGQHE